MTQLLGEMLVAAGAVTEAQVREALAYQRNGAMRIGEALVKLGATDEGTVFRTLAKQQGLPFVDLEKGKIPDAVIARIPAELAREQRCLPILEKNGRLVVAIDDPQKRILIDQLAFNLGGEVQCALATPTSMKRALDRYHGAKAEETVAATMKMEGEDEVSDAPIVRLVSRTLQQALEQRASDIHIEPGHGRVRIRFRVDGMLRDVAEHPEHLHAPLVSRLKILAQMDIAEKRKPQDGRIGFKLEGREIDVRASILPGNHGESMVLRLLDRSR
ncbi:MAG: Flp pilus assembly complex ATPase component TadA, partial [Planctomycetes bacterium]|nr:Flp pilus assembly complex ATPase component TadA [Planctomycetota bacterium]